MNCEQCKEEVFELIEREAVDPAGVREILDRCPDCRALFDGMKAALVAVDQLPLEDPPAHVDAEVLRAAAMRRARMAPLRKRRLQAPTWAMAAMALLAVGVGVWSIPRSTDFETEDALGTPEVQLDHKERAEPLVEAPAKSTVARRERGQAKRKARSSPDAPEAVPAEAFGANAVAGLDMPDGRASGPSAPGAARTTAPAVESSDEEARQDRDDAAEACRKTIADFEKRIRQDEDYAPDPVQQLALGRCYAKLGDTKRARTWLERAATHPKTKTRALTALNELTAN